MSGNTAKYLLSIGNVESRNFEVTGFSGVDAISSPYWFDIEFRMSTNSKAAPPDAGILDKACRLDIEHNGEMIPYCGIAVELRVCDSDDALYAIRLAPRMYRLSMNFSNRVFQNLTIPDIIKRVIDDAGLSEYFRFDINPDNIKYPMREFCVQYQESDLAFISRLMEESGIWYYFHQVKQPSGALNECAVVTDDFSKFPILSRSIPFMKGQGLAEVTKSGKTVESINYISASAALMPKSVRVRAYNHLVPEAPPDGISDVRGGHLGRVYEYGGTLKNSSEAEYRASLCARRLWVENSQTECKGNCASFRAGLRLPIKHDKNKSLDGQYLLVMVKHTGGWESGAYTYHNEFFCVRAENQIYAPPLRTPVPRIDGVTTAPIGATGDRLPTLNEYGNYNVNMPFVLKDDKNRNNENSNDYGKSKHVRLAQPSGGMSGDKPYGIHFPSKRGAEMVLAFVDGDPNRPIGLGFVPNAAAPSVARSTNSVENVMRSWGGSELVMDDTDGKKNIKLTTPGIRYLELHDGDELVRVKSQNCEMLFNDAGKFAEINAGGHIIEIVYKDGEGNISIKTVKEHIININDKDDAITLKTASGNVIEMNDPGNVITVQNAGAKNKAVFNGKDDMITLDSADNTVVLNGKEKRITLESTDSKVAVDGKGKKIILENKDNKVVIDSGSNSVSVDAKKDINLKAGGKIVFDAKGGISNNGQTYDFS